jgi:BarA-like signal transduction histidine kinase
MFDIEFEGRDRIVIIEPNSRAHRILSDVKTETSTSIGKRNL